MIIDGNLLFSDEQDLQGVGAAATTLADYSVDLGKVGARPGPGNEVEIFFQVMEDFDSAGDDTTCQFQVITDTVEAMSSPTVRAMTAALAQATLVAGYRTSLKVPIEANERFLGVQYVTGSDPTAGKVTAGIVETVQTAESDWTAETGR